MITIKRQKIILAVLLFFVVCVFLSTLYAAIVWIPAYAQNDFGDPDPALEKSTLFLLSLRLIIDIDHLKKPTGLMGKPETFVIEPGQPAGIVAKNLESLQAVNDAEDIVNYWEYKGQDRFIQSGVFLIPPSLSPLDIAEKLVSESSDQIKFAFLAGWRKEEIDHLLHLTDIVLEKEQITDLEASILKDCFPEQMNDIKTIEGFLFPDEYEIWKGTSSREIYCQFTKKFFESLPSNYADKAANNGLSLQDAVVLASIVEKEAVLGEEAPLIAGVFLNRLDAKIPLQSDPTVQYAAANSEGSKEWWKNPLESADLEIDSPYNTYIYNGLPPAPICNPSLNSLLAVVDPEYSDYFYFRTACDQSGRHKFSETYQEHLAAACD